MTTTNSAANSQVETIDVISDDLVSGGPWEPFVGSETNALLRHLNLPDDSSGGRVRDEAIAVLSQCVPPTASKGAATGLVFGYVQSGKTMSFTTVTALARDNGYRMVIIIAGVSIPLFRQSVERLRNDLRLNIRRDRKWKHLENPKSVEADNIQGTLDEWQDPTVPEMERQTVLLTVMKNSARLRDLNALLARLRLDGAPILVIDDEADQAGLNTEVQTGQESTTYRRIKDLRQHLPHHTYLQYTATPQAPLLINLLDILSPQFVVLLTPGQAYTGGFHFFRNNVDLVRTIPAPDIPPPNSQLTQPPQSLLSAIRIFFLGVAAAYCQGSIEGNRAMLIHPSQKTQRHSEYFHWTQQIKDTWLNILQNLLDGDATRRALIDSFRPEYADLARTVKDLPRFEQLVTVLPRAIRKTNIKEVNASRGRTPPVDWAADYAHILVGGQAMDRGFTVEGLTVTYMPRPLGVGNADTIQQRARFFGYKGDYLGYCRVFLHPLLRQAYASYVDHEEDVRERLRRHGQTGKPLSDWKRAFFLDGALQPTRNNVLDVAYMQGAFADDWFASKAPHDSHEAIEDNRRVVAIFLETLELQPDEGHPNRTVIQTHKVAREVLLNRLLKELLVPFNLPRPGDSQNFTGVRLQIARYLEDHPNETATIFVMSGGTERERTLDDSDEVPNLFQGDNLPVYPGDRQIRDPGKLTVQLHRLTIKTQVHDSRIPNVWALAIWVPHVMSGTWLVQPQGNLV